MKQSRSLIWIFVLPLLFADVSSVRAAEATLSPQKPQRIVSLTLGTDEILFSLVDPKRIVAVTYLSVDPGVSHVVEEAKKVPNHLHLSVEGVIALHPDLVLVATYTAADVVKALTDAKLPVMKLALFSSIKGVEQNILAVGKAVGEEARAEEIVSEMNRRLQYIANRVAAASTRPGVLFYSPTGVVAGKETMFDEMAPLTGGRNRAAEAGLIGHQKISIETLIQLDPEIVIVSDWNPEEPDFYQKLITHPALGHLSAVRNRHVFAVPEKHLSSVSQYIVDGIEQVARVIHPELFAPPAATGTASDQRGRP
ncbi:MAG: ABC transporter substrate-binding protein [Candidatus Manganitrophaceae bacterium]|nr:MAG: ABC transporter substrate-binding protein [Candidatus Manganitrophaceae bacterium]